MATTEAKQRDEIPNATEATAVAVTTTQASSTKHKKKRKKRTPKKHILSQFAIRNPSWAYIHLQHLSSSSSTPPPLDAVTALLHITAALSQFLGLHGSATPFDILKVDGQEVWIRLAAEDRSALVAAMGGWISANGEGWVVKGCSSWDANASDRAGGQDLFAP